MTGFDGPARTICAYADGYVVGGDFQHAGDVPSNHISYWNGQSWQALGDGLDGSVRDLVVWDGDLVAAGYFTTSGAESVPHVARWSGTSWEPFGAGPGHETHALCVFEGALHAERSRWEDSAWVQLFDTNREVTDLMVSHGSVVATGPFTTAGGQWADGIAIWDGTTLTNPDVPQIEISLDATIADGQIFVLCWSDTDTNEIISWDGQQWYNVCTVPSLSRTVFNRITSGAGIIAVAGMTGSWEGLPGSAVFFIWDGATWEWSELDSFHVPEAAMSIGGDIWFGGLTFRAEDIACHGAIRYMDGQWSAPTRTGNGLDGTILTFAQYDGRLFAGGTFSVAGHQPAVKCASWDGMTWRSEDTYQWGGFDPGLDGFVSHLLVRDNFEIIGYYGLYEGDFSGIRINDEWWLLGASGDPADVYSPEPLHDLKIDNHGDWWSSSSYSVLSWDGQQWDTLAGVCEGEGEAITRHLGNVYIGGRFDTLADLPPTSIAIWDGSTWAIPGTGLPMTVNALCPYGDWLIAGGSFTSDRQDTPSYLAAWDGFDWLDLGADFDGTVTCLLTAENVLYVGGEFTHVAGLQANHLVRYDGQWSAMEGGLSGVPSTMHWYDGALYISGSFETAGGLPSVNIARWTEEIIGTAVPDQQAPLSTVSVLHPAKPNPFNPATEIKYEVPLGGQTRLTVHDLRGSLVATLVDELLQTGQHVARWDGVDDLGRAAPSGTYILRLLNGDRVSSQKLMLTR
ncbi:T9SS type A sorting domain-containing protein [bacterium]|nr:T9SS type A sorting domain-containing protein [bacterium]